jgi:hypothetical protein
MQYSNIRTNDEEFRKYHDLLIKDNLIVTDADPAIKYDFSTIPRNIIDYLSDTIFQMWQTWEYQQDLIDPVNYPDIYAEVDRLNWILFNMWIRSQGHD